MRSRLWIIPVLLFSILIAGCTEDELKQSFSSLNPVYKETQVIIPQSRMSRNDVHRLGYIAPGQTTAEMRGTFGAPYATDGKRTEYFPIQEDDTTWVAVHYGADGRYEGYNFSANNNVYAANARDEYIHDIDMG